MYDRTRGRFEEPFHLLTTLGQPRRETLATQGGRERWVLPHAFTGPVPSSRKGRQQRSVLRAAIDDPAIGDDEDVLPEGVRGTMFTKRFEVGLESGLGVRLGRQLGWP